MAEAFLRLSSEEQLEALRVAATNSGRPDYLLEKDIWVVWALAALFESPFGAHLAFKGGTSLSKAYRAIRRFSEDVDVTYDIRELIPDVVGDAPNALPSSFSQAKKWTDAVRERLPAWLATAMLPVIQQRLAETGSSGTARTETDDRILIEYRHATASPPYVPHRVTLEFGARATGEPVEVLPVECDAAPYLPDLAFPRAQPRVMRVERTFWEKATAIHVACSGGRFDTGYARHWYDLARLGDLGYAAKAVAEREIALSVADHKSRFFRERDGSGNWIDYHAAVSGALKLVPDDQLQTALMSLTEPW